ncbi:hypothetical protein Clacol_001549 [Clathrus columnatus]|uniref:Glycoside hydrolase family 125 protein n=1 Tax=Clathrus columnatus TaxID=1419009 RepID=A0AAV5A3W5_9AGAM|nr:hypothetical protein Clacol_001549 [Clathrus columnatus]
MTPQKRVKRQSSRPIFGWLQKRLGGSGSSNSNSGNINNGNTNRTLRNVRSDRPRSVTMPHLETSARQPEITHVNLNDNDSRIGRSTPAQSSRSTTWSPPPEVADDDASIRPLPPTSPPSPAPSRSSSSYLSDPRTFKSIAASTKPTTLLSIDLGSNGMAHIAQAPPTPSTASHAHVSLPRFSTSSVSVSNSNSITFSVLPPNMRSEIGGANVSGGLQAPLHTSHHPRYNPRPSSPPQDNASVLTLASSAFAFPGVRPENWYGDSQSQFGLETSSQPGEIEDVQVEDASVRALRPRSSRRGSWESEASGWSAKFTRDRSLRAGLNHDLDASTEMTGEDEENNGELLLQTQAPHLTLNGRTEALRDDGARTPPAKELVDSDYLNTQTDIEIPDSDHLTQASQRTPTKNPLLVILATWFPFVAIAQSANCPDYTTFSSSPQGNPSAGPLGLPFMRPSSECRTFTSTAVEKVISDMKERIKDPDLARLFENTFPNTLDTTVKYFDKLHHYRDLLPLDPNLATLEKAVINNEAIYIKQYPYCGAFQPPPESGLAPSTNSYATLVLVNPPVNDTIVFECKYEIDSLCAFLKLSRTYYESTSDSSFMNDNCRWDAAIDQIFQVIDEQSQPTFDKDFNVISYYNWTGEAGSLSPPVENEGNGEPKAYTGLVGTHHRPSDDLSIYPFLTPANAMLSVELTHLADMLQAVKRRPDVVSNARTLSKRISDAVWNTTVVNDIFAYETNGFGGRVIMDDANVPSLLALPYLGFLDKTHPAYVATRKQLLSRGNPYYAQGDGFFGIGGPHVDVYHPWPMSLVSSIFGTDDDQEILTALYTIANNTAGLGLIHESQSIYSHTDYTRPWFAWANSYFAEMILDLAQRKPGLILKDDTPYIIGKTN